MSLPHGLLGLLNYKDMTGYELSKTFDDSLSFFWKAQASQIYRELDRMETFGWLTSHVEIQIERPNKRIYTITEKGKDELKKWLEAEIPQSFLPPRNEILIRIFFSGLNSREDNISALKKVIDTYQGKLKEMENFLEIINSYRTFAKEEEDILYWELTGDFGRMYHEMCIQWAKDSIQKIEMKREKA